MSGRSSRLADLGLCVALLAACSSGGKKEPPKPEFDPAKVLPYAKQIYDNAPSMGSARACTDADFTGGGMALTQVSLRKLLGKAADQEAYHLPWVNPPEVEDPAVRLLVDPPAGVDPHLVRQAAWQFVSAPFYIVYRTDQVNAPMALGLKELIRGTVEVRVLRHERNGTATCSKLVYFQNDKTKSDAAIEASDKALMDPTVVKAMQDDLRDQYLKKVPVIPLVPRAPAPG
jgi:hypothetical protein